MTIIIEPHFWQTWWFYTICGLAGFTTVYVIHRRRIKAVRSKALLKQQVMETEMAALRAQINPHFIFNSISAIDSLIQNNKKEDGTHYLARFAKLIRNVLDSSKNNTIPFHKDFETIKLFIELERFRSSNKFNYELKADDELLHSDFRVPPMLVQPFIENAIHHGLRNKEGGDKQLTVRATLKGDYIIYTITDNGVGRAKAEELKKINRPEHVSYGIQISRDRLRNFNHRFQFLHETDKDDLSITDLYINDHPAGTRVRLKLKIS